MDPAVQPNLILGVPMRTLLLSASVVLALVSVAAPQTIDVGQCGVSLTCTGTVTAAPIVVAPAPTPTPTPTPTPPPPPTGTTTYLSDLVPTAAVNGWGPYERDRSNGENAAGDGRVLTLNGVTFPKGLGVHAASSLTYTLPAGCSLLQAIIGVDDEVTNAAASVRFEAYVGTTRIYQSSVLGVTSASVSLAVPLSAPAQLRLVVTDGGSNGITADHADWADAKVTCTGTIATLPPPSSGAVAFLSRPASPPIVRDGGSNVVVENVTIQGPGVTNPAGIGITVRNVANLTIRNVDMANLEGGMYLYNISGTLLVEGVRSRNIGTGRIGSGMSNHIQLAESSVSGAIRNNRFLCGQTEDMLSTWHSGGRGVGQELVIEDNQLEGAIVATSVCRPWTSGSGTGIIVSDGGGSPKNGHIIVRRNRLLNPGQVGLQIIDGPGLQIAENVLVAESYGPNNNPITSWEGQPIGVVRDNRYRWINANGSEPAPWFYGGGNLTVTGNIRDTTLTPAALRISMD